MQAIRKLTISKLMQVIMRDPLRKLMQPDFSRFQIGRVLYLWNVRSRRKRSILTILTVLLLLGSNAAFSGVLPEDRADVLFHSYSGGGIDIDGPAILVRKQLGEVTSLTGKYYVDSISSASIDVVTSGASRYSEERVEKSIGADFLNEETTISVGISNSEENDYSADTAFFTFSEDLFGDLLTIVLGYSRGWDTVSKTGDSSFEREVDRQNYRLGLSQIVNKSIVAALEFETITDEGFLNNPYRFMRFCNATDDCSIYRTGLEVYPNTRTSHSVAVRGKYYFDYRASLNAKYKFFQDTWGIRAHTIEAGYTHPYQDKWMFDFKVRFYTQKRADFFSDLFAREGAQNYMARDKELSSLSNYGATIATAYEFGKSGWGFIDRASVNAAFSYVKFNYADFRDLRVDNVTPGSEPLYYFSANIFQFYLSIWY